MEDLFWKKMKCHVCSNDFESPRVRRSRYSVASVDTDFCTYYKGLNPLYYSVAVCPACGYAFTENFKKPGKKEVEEMRAALSPPLEDLNTERTFEMAVESFERAIASACLQKERNALLAGLHLHLAWVFRHAGKEAEEKEQLERALDSYAQAFEKDAEISNEARLLYLLGELNRRLDRPDEAVRWFSKVINDQSIDDAGIIRMARERWQELRLD